MLIFCRTFAADFNHPRRDNWRVGRPAIHSQSRPPKKECYGLDQLSNHLNVTSMQNLSSYVPSLMLEDGTEVRLCPLDLTKGKPLYCSAEGQFYHLTRGRLSHIRHNFAPSHYTPGRHCHNGKRGNDYPYMRNFGTTRCHILIASTWIGPRPLNYECDHLNGVVTDYRAANLQWVTPSENRKRAGLLRVLRNIGRDPQQMSREELLAVFNHYEFAPKGELRIKN